MCVEVTSKSKPKTVDAWKLFKSNLRGLCYGGRFRRGVLYTSEYGPGFQAFVHKKDAQASKEKDRWSGRVVIVKVRLYQARRGIIQYMGDAADSKAGYVAPQMKILPKGS